MDIAGTSEISSILHLAFTKIACCAHIFAIHVILVSHKLIFSKCEVIGAGMAPFKITSFPLLLLLFISCSRSFLISYSK